MLECLGVVLVHFQVQLCALWKATGHGQGLASLPSTCKTQTEVQAPGSGLAQLSLWWAFAK